MLNWILLEITFINFLHFRKYDMICLPFTERNPLFFGQKTVFLVHLPYLLNVDISRLLWGVAANVFGTKTSYELFFILAFNFSHFYCLIFASLYEVHSSVAFWWLSMNKQGRFSMQILRNIFFFTHAQVVSEGYAYISVWISYINGCLS